MLLPSPGRHVSQDLPSIFRPQDERVASPGPIVVQSGQVVVGSIVVFVAAGFVVVVVVVSFS